MASQKDLKNAGLKVTSARLAILSLFEDSDERHQSAEQVHNSLQAHGHDISLATVYRVLSQFENAGILDKHRFDDEHSVFELNDGQHHDHIVCVKCQRVEEFYDETIERQQEKIAAKLGFTITDHSLHLYGMCDKCF